MTEKFTLAQVAEKWGVSPETVRGWIHSGELAALVINPHARRKAYRVDAAALVDFEDRRRVSAVKIPRRAKRPQYKVYV